MEPGGGEGKTQRRVRFLRREAPNKQTACTRVSEVKTEGLNKSEGDERQQQEKGERQRARG